MRDPYRRYRAIQQASMPFSTPRPTGHREKHLTPFVALICGLTGGKHAHWPTLADHAPSNGATPGSLIKRFTRWLNNDRHTIDGWVLPVAAELLNTLAAPPITLVLDGRVAGCGCLALLLRVVYHGRALPRGWVVVSAPTGHFPAQTPCALLAQVQAIMPQDAQGTFVGDGAFDGVAVQADLRKNGWHSGWRTASPIRVRRWRPRPRRRPGATAR